MNVRLFGSRDSYDNAIAAPERGGTAVLVLKRVPDSDIAPEFISTFQRNLGPDGFGLGDNSAHRTSELCLGFGFRKARFAWHGNRLARRLTR